METVIETVSMETVIETVMDGQSSRSSRQLGDSYGDNYRLKQGLSCSANEAAYFAELIEQPTLLS